MTTTPTPAGSNAGSQARQKRVLPSRSRRGGPGIGSCDVDIMILDTQKRKAENEPLIPPATRFLLTTNSSHVPSSSSSASELDNTTDERYFDRPEVLKAYKEQQSIQTPEFSLLSEDASVGGRFRPRSSEDEGADTSDAVYEKRHRKYETFEKRQRLREKEKLKHEQYKLKERIEQLRAMDGTAFLALPASSFSPIPGLAQEGAASDEEPNIANLPGAHVNGAAAYHEGERRRNEMLNVASTLEERYRTLLPDRKATERDKYNDRTGSVSVSAEPELRAGLQGEDELEDEMEEPMAELAKAESHKIKLKIKLVAKNPLISPPNNKRRSTLPPSMTRSPLVRRSKIPDSAHLASPSPSFSVPSASLLNHNMEGNLDQDEESISRPRLRKRIRPSMATLDSGDTDEELPADYSPFADDTYGDSASAASPVHHPVKSHPSNSAKSEHAPGALMTAAIRSASAPKSRKTQRHVTAFGMKVPGEVDRLGEYEIPQWVRGEVVEEDVEGLDGANGVPALAQAGSTWDDLGGADQFDHAASKRRSMSVEAADTHQGDEDML